MEIHLTRQEILREVRGLLGLQTNSALASQVQEQHVIAVQSAARKVAQDCRWVAENRRVRVELQTAQDTVNYPTGVAPGAIVNIAVWDDGASYTLEPRSIGPEADLAVAKATEEGTVALLQDRPRYYQQRSQIHLWPPTDKPYSAEIEYMASVEMPTDATISVVDGQLIVFIAASTIARMMGDKEQAEYLEARYGDRLTALKGWQSAGTRFALDSEADLGENEFSIERLKPNWDTRPTTSNRG